VIRALSRQELDRFASIRVTLNGRRYTAVDWFVDDTGLILGAIVYHGSTLDWSFVILTRSIYGDFRAFDRHTGLRSLEEARRRLFSRMETALLATAK
jgi:hypothetical protein